MGYVGRARMAGLVLKLTLPRDVCGQRMIQWLRGQGRTATSRVAEAPRRGTCRLSNSPCKGRVCIQDDTSRDALILSYGYGGMPTVCQGVAVCAGRQPGCLGMIQYDSAWCCDHTGHYNHKQHVGHGRMSASRAVGASEEAGAAKALSDRIIQHHSNGGFLKWGYPPMIHFHGFLNINHPFLQCTPFMETPKWPTFQLEAKQPADAVQKRSSPDRVQKFLAVHVELGILSRKHLKHTMAWSLVVAGHHAAQLPCRDLRPRIPRPKEEEELSCRDARNWYKLILSNTLDHILNSFTMFYNDMQYDQVISGNLAGSDSVFARGIVLPHVGGTRKIN